LGFAGLQASKVPGAEVARAAFGPFGEKLIGMIAALAAATTVNATLIVGARTNYALGRDWPIVSFMSHWDGRRDVPVRALLVQGGIALVLIALAAFEKSGIEAMINFTAPVFWFFFLLVGIGLFVLRLRRPAAPRPFRVPFYPVVPMLFCIACAFLFYNSVTYTLSQHAIQWAIAIMAAGFVAWLLARTRPAR
jgi:amino acid transporter